MAVTDKPTDTTSTTGGTGNALSAKEKEAKAAAAAAKNTANQKKKNHPSNASSKKNKQQQVSKSKFEGLASGTSPMKGIVVALANGNLLGQYRVLQNTMAGTAASEKAYGLDSAILELVAKVESDFVTSKSDPLKHSTVVTIYTKDATGADTTTPTGEKRLVCFDPILKASMDSNYFIDVKIQKANWNNYERFSQAYYRTAIGNVEDVIITYCRADKRMALVEINKDLIGFLQILRSVCAQTNGIVKVDQEFQNLHTLHAAIAFKQAANVDDSTFSKQVQDRYKSAIFTCGKFAFGEVSLEKVLSALPTPTTFTAYLALKPADQVPIDKLVEERTVARLIVKNSLNKNLKTHLMTTYSTAAGDCYPNTISDALALLSTFAVQPAKNTTTEDAIVSYHEASSPDPVSSIKEEAEDDLSDPEPGLTIEELPSDTETNQASVMATVIAEATKEADDDQFFGASFAQLQDVDDIYDDNEPDFVTCAHVVDRPGGRQDDSTDFDSNSDIDHAGDRHGNSSDWDTDEWNRELEENRNRPKTGKSPITINKAHCFETVVYLTAQRVKNTGTVRIKSYDVDDDDVPLVSYEYDSPTPEHIIDYSDVVREKLKLSGIRNIAALDDLFEGCSVAEAARRLRQQLIDVNQTALHGDTVRYLKEETDRHHDHLRFYKARYDRMITEIGPDDERMVFPQAHVLLHHTVVAVSINQRRRKPNRWINKVTRKLVNCGINTVELLESALKGHQLNNILHRHGLPKFTCYSLYNNIWITYCKIIAFMCDAIGNAMITFGETIMEIESIVFNKLNYTTPFYNVFHKFEHMLSGFNIFTHPVIGMRPKPISRKHNSKNNKTSSGSHLHVFFARKRRRKRHSIVISGSIPHLMNDTNRTKDRTDAGSQSRSKNQTKRPHISSVSSTSVIYPIDDPSCQDISWYDAISPYWTGGMIWDGAYVLNHQVVSVTTDPIFVSDLLPAFELSATIQTPKARSGGKHVGPRTTIAIDSGSSIHIFKDAFLLADIQADENSSISVRTTDSKFQIKDIGRLCDDLDTLPLPSDGYYFYPNGVANLLSLAMLTDTKRVVMDSAIDNAIYVFNDDGSYVRFGKTSNGMYCIDITTNDDHHIVMAHQTVKGESAHFSAIDCRRAAKVRDLQEALACPSDFDLANAIEHNVIGNSPFTRRDVRIAKQIFGPDVPAMKGKTVKNKSIMPREDDVTDIPSFIMKEYSNVHLAIDIMHINGIKFLISHSKHIGLIQTYCVRKNNRDAILACILKIIQTYKSRSVFKVVTIEADGAFECIKHELQDKPYNITLSTCDADRHVETVERQIRFLKERIRAVRLMMPYKKIPKRFTVEMVLRVTMLINSLPKQNGIHSILSPREIVTGKKFRCPTVKVGQYVQGHTGGTNSTDEERSIDALYIGRADNGSGHVVFKLSTKQPVSINRVTIIPTTEALINTVNEIAEQEKQPEGIEFADINGRVTLDDFAANVINDDDSNASDIDFKMDEEYREELKKELKLEAKDKTVDESDPDSKGFGGDEPDSQIDFFQNPIQQHNRDTLNENEDAPIILDSRTRSGMNLANSTSKQECGKDKKKKKRTIFENDTNLIEDDLEDDDMMEPTITSNDDIITNDTSEEEEEDEPSAPRELDSDLGSYWNLAHSKQACVLSTIASYSHVEASKSTPQYGFNRGLKEFGAMGYEATMKELDDNLLGMGAHYEPKLKHAVGIFAFITRNGAECVPAQ
ncbi:hypothetical protein FRACYDRAFT_246701 [Fragilariopsis cylindrus CCMP1102]|uniref:Integrase catalytic domain-containing protein n=1 Tax=Fragilariopsis cylindrus CCMP1102 TaxID=635003 RepID=A0A1E7EYC7_9STRA|nr:hypothetical protein FRACYDRAFT_246701 [Fragilariopsis cylindrus CCMP1102]|eukprot:OEU10829.1 hypothetical protein FRACYDRAFT_246701 [Fragilariopsis cylindrus CCMP1102]